MRLTVEPQDRSPVLGPPIREQKPAPAPVPVAPGVVRGPDGKLSTDLPDPCPVWHPTPYGLPAFNSAMDKLGQHVTDTEYLRLRLVEDRGGCSCHISPPCNACCEPLTLSEAESLGIVDGDFGGLNDEEAAAIRDALGYVELPAEPHQSFSGLSELTLAFTEAERSALADFSAWIESELTAALVMGLPTKLVDSGDTTD